jgi:hypothetical protein
MSFSLFRSQIQALTGRQHVSRLQFAETISKAYNGLVERSIETVTAGGKVIAPAVGLPGLIGGIYGITEANLHQHNPINFFNQIAPYFYLYWTAKQIVGPTGVVIVTSTGSYKGPKLPQNFDFNIWVTVFCAVCTVHMTTLIGTYTNNVTGVTTPWAGGLLMHLP